MSIIEKAASRIDHNKEMAPAAPATPA
ncbi:MAG: hypothetical protein JWR40_5139, partial [Massilia sp.]|nr:hypothetical protein [Massilia sp.]